MKAGMRIEEVTETPGPGIRLGTEEILVGELFDAGDRQAFAGSTIADRKMANRKMSQPNGRGILR